MKLYYYLFGLLFCFLSLPMHAEEIENPFQEMSTQPYVAYEARLRELYQQIDRVDSLQSRQWLEQVREVACTTRSEEWELEARLFEISYRFREGFRHSPLNTYHSEEALQDLIALSDEAQKNGLTYTYLRTLHSIMNFYYSLVGNYEMAFEYARLLNSQLDKVNAAEYVSKLYAFKDIALMYYQFRDYGESAFYLNKIIQHKEIATSIALIQSAYNDMGLVYRNHWNDLDTSDNYFRKVLEIRSSGPDSTRIDLIWEAIAKGNLGYNNYLRGEFREAIPLLEFSYQHMVLFDDYTYASGAAIALADIYVKQKELDKCRRQIDVARDILNRTTDKSRWRYLYPVICKYYSLTGKQTEALAYLDSAVKAQEEYNNRYSGLQLLRVEQRVHHMEQRAKEEELLTEKIRSNNYRNTVIILAIAFLLLTILLIYTLVLYRKRREAYRQLVRRAREWAHRPVTQQVQVIPKETGKKIQDRLQQLMDDKKPWLSPDLTLEELSDMLQTDRNTLSAVLNQFVGKNFNSYINEYRIKEAVRLMDTDNNFSIDSIAFDSGFNNRISFYRAFKKETGLSPTTFRKNKP